MYSIGNEVSDTYFVKCVRCNKQTSAYFYKELAHEEWEKLNKKRQSWDDYFYAIAKLVSTRATCDRLRVGCVFVRNKRIIATGYNGSLPDSPHCDDVGHEMVDGHCVRVIHAEQNALYQCAKFGIPTEGVIAYVTHKPCNRCDKALRMAGIKEIVWDEEYDNG